MSAPAKSLLMADIIVAFRRLSEQHPEAHVLDIQTAVALELDSLNCVVYASLSPAWWTYLYAEHEKHRQALPVKPSTQSTR